MKKMLISEDEKSRILNLHQNLGYKTSLNEQVSPQQPQPNAQKPTEPLGNYFTSDPIGKKIASISPAFAKWSNDNKIQTSRAKYQLEPVKSDLTAVGTDGKTYIISLYYFNQTKGNIPQDSEEKLNAAREAIKQKVAELNIGQVANSKCFVLDYEYGYKPSNPSNNQCTTAYSDYKQVVKSTNFDYYMAMNQISKFASVAPKFQPKQG
jgi:hypothetical protein